MCFTSCEVEKETVLLIPVAIAFFSLSWLYILQRRGNPYPAMETVDMLSESDISVNYTSSSSEAGKT